jgi:HKD family nuclease
VEAVNNRVDELHAVVGINERGTTVEGLLRLLDVATTLKVFFKHPRQTFHPKLYWFEGGTAGDSTTAIIGAATLIRGGLFTNFEASLIAQIDHATAAADEGQLLDTSG